ncbi:MAG: prolyl oligopeptidase family serine peptidase [Chloroflexota bacterium]|nr:prolyl oligopeptidase family serine peptidase [Chloroflexota bacterium]
MVTTAPYGSWKSPITSKSIVAEAVGFGGIALDGDDIYWLESRPSEGGRRVIVRRTPDGHTADVTPRPFNVRTRVHEYGEGDFTVDDGVIYFTNFDDQRLYRQEVGGEPEPLTPEADPAGGLRYADFIVDSARSRLICVHEDHTAGGHEPVNTLAAVSLANGALISLVSGSDFYAAPRLSPDGSQLAWLSWNHPNMPWDGVELWVAPVSADGSLGTAALVAGGQDESILQPEWSPDGRLYFVSDRTNWWNLYRRNGDGRVEPVTTPLDREFGKPHWVFGMATYGFTSAGRIICGVNNRGSWSICSLDTGTGQLDDLGLSQAELGRTDLKVDAGQAVFAAGSPSAPVSIQRLDLADNVTDYRVEGLRRASSTTVDPGYLSAPRAIEFPTENGLTAHAFYYPPRNRDFAAPDGEKPPLLVKSHGGPTSAASVSLSLSIQYWTSRGIGVLDVNYGGSTGFGREYRDRLKGRWGIVDVEDCVNGALYLVAQGEVDGDRLAIDGGSAGGYTTLAALAFRHVFAAGASHYGVSDLAALAQDTHKFESRYLDSLVGPYPERNDLYMERSPIHHTDGLSCPLILFQGLEDRIVPPSQAELMFEAVRAKGLPCAYIPFEGEQHGFRRSENIRRALDGELYFYSRVFGFDLADEVEPVQIENL